MTFFNHFSLSARLTNFTNRLTNQQLTENDGREVIWDELSPMTIARFGHGMVECMGWAYVVGEISVIQLYLVQDKICWPFKFNTTYYHRLTVSRSIVIY